MKKVFLMLLILSLVIYSQDKNKKAIDEKSGKPMLIGICDFKAFADTNFSWWFNSESDMYKPDSLLIEKLKSLSDKPEITIVMGSWCSDSKREVPRFYKILNECQYDLAKVNLICVDRKKESPDGNVKDLEIKLVPTFIFNRNKKEIGRIIETPTGRLEEDFFNIISQ